MQHDCMSSLFMCTAHTNRDQQTGMGTPWEIRFQNNYTVNMKGGNLRGYATLFSFVPDLHLGMHHHSHTHQLTIYVGHAIVCMYMQRCTYILEKKPAAITKMMTVL